MTSMVELQARVTQSNVAVERLSNENRQLHGSLGTQNEQATDVLANRDAEIQRIWNSLRDAEAESDRQMNVHRQKVMDLEAEIERLTG